jgi:hypothetical protein
MQREDECAHGLVRKLNELHGLEDIVLDGRVMLNGS